MTGGLGLHNTKRVDPGYRQKSVTQFFQRDGPRLAAEQRDKWRIGSQLVAAHSSYRRTGDRLEWIEFCRDVISAGLYERKGWAPAAALRPPPFYESPDFDPRDYLDEDEYDDGADGGLHDWFDADDGP